MVEAHPVTSASAVRLAAIPVRAGKAMISVLRRVSVPNTNVGSIAPVHHPYLRLPLSDST